jgi:hypothetical protein
LPQTAVRPEGGSDRIADRDIPIGESVHTRAAVECSGKRK